MILQPTTFTNQVLANYTNWWNKYNREQAKLFRGEKIGKDKSPLVQREFAENSSRRKEYQCPLESIPYIEITPLYRVVKNGILFVNCNPSGTDYEYYTGFKCLNDICIYNNSDNTYFDAVEKFAIEIGPTVQFAMIDVFPLVIQNQAVLKKAIIDTFKDPLLAERKGAIEELLRSFCNNIAQIQPKVIVATNAFVKDLFTDNDEKRPYTLRQLKLVDDFQQDEDKVCYHIEIKGHKTTLFCGGMIAGGHQMDTESKKRLIRDVRHYYSEQRGFPITPGKW